MERKDIRALEILDLAPNTVIVREGEEKQGFYVILNGEVMISQNSKPIRFLKEGDVFGLESYFLHRAYSITAKAVSDARVSFYSYEVVKEFIYCIPQIVERIVASLVGQLEQTTQVAGENIAPGGEVDLSDDAY